MLPTPVLFHRPRATCLLLPFLLYPRSNPVKFSRTFPSLTSLTFPSYAPGQSRISCEFPLGKYRMKIHRIFFSIIYRAFIEAKYNSIARLFYFYEDIIVEKKKPGNANPPHSTLNLHTIFASSQLFAIDIQFLYNHKDEHVYCDRGNVFCRYKGC